ncbi:MAG: dephospho-CoA kinase [Odoribacter splanchnicus]
MKPVSPSFDFIICVTASEATRLKRVILRDATNEDKVKERMQNQAADTEKCKNSDFIIYNDEDHMVVQQVLDVLNKLNLKIQ